MENFNLYSKEEKIFISIVGSFLFSNFIRLISPTIMDLVIVVYGILFVLYAGYKIITKSLYHKFDTTEINIDEKCVRERAIKLWTNKSYYYPYVKYSYIVDGNTYISTKVSDDLEDILFKNKEDAELLMENIVKSKKVFYKKEDLSNGVLEHSFPKKRKLFYASLFFFGLIIIYIWTQK